MTFATELVDARQNAKNVLEDFLTAADATKDFTVILRLIKKSIFSKN